MILLDEAVKYLLRFIGVAVKQNCICSIALKYMDFKYLYKKLFFLTFFLLATTLVFEQNTFVSGTVTDACTKQPLGYVTVVFAGTQKKKKTKKHGKYSITTDKPVDRRGGT